MSIFFIFFFFPQILSTAIRIELFEFLCRFICSRGFHPRLFILNPSGFSCFQTLAGPRSGQIWIAVNAIHGIHFRHDFATAKRLNFFFHLPSSIFHLKADIFHHNQHCFLLATFWFLLRRFQFCDALFNFSHNWWSCLFPVQSMGKRCNFPAILQNLETIHFFSSKDYLQL